MNHGLMSVSLGDLFAELTDEALSILAGKLEDWPGSTPPELAHLGELGRGILNIARALGQQRACAEHAAALLERRARIRRGEGVR